MKRVRKRASALVTLLILITLIFTALMLIFSRQAQREYAYRLVENRGQGQLLASSGLSQGIANFAKDKTYGQAGQTLRETMPCDADDQACFALSFEPDAGRRGPDIPEFCINNWGKDTPVYNGDKSQILCPENALYLVCYASYRGQRYSCSALLAAPPFDSAVASGATVRSDDGFLLGSVPAGFDARNGVRPEDLSEAKMQAGGDISIHGKSLLVGKALAAHNVDYDKATVDLSRGSILGNSKIDAVPDIDLSKLDFTGKTGVQTLSGPFASKVTLSGLAQGKSLSFPNGLHLDGGVLRLSGNLVVEGGITGRGALIVDGNVTIAGASNLTTDNQVAVLAGGGINVTGTGSSNSYFQGLLYAKGEGGVSVVNSTLLGTLVSTSATAPVQVERSVIAYDAKMTKIGVDVGFSGYPPGGFPIFGAGGGPPNYLRLKALPGMTAGSVPSPNQLAKAGISTLVETNFELVDGAGNPVDGDLKAAISTEFLPLKSMNQQLATLNGDPLLPQGKFDLDLNRFLKATDRLRIIWRR